MKDLRQLPKLRDSLAYVYLEHCRIDREQSAIAIYDEDGLTPIPCASIALLLLGPGSRVTHAAMSALADNNCLVAWCGEEGVRLYCYGSGGSRSAAPLIEQARLVSDAGLRVEVARRMYSMRFQDEPPPHLGLEQLRGWEGRRVRDAYALASKETGVTWKKREYDRSNWSAADPVNRALTAANACLYGVCHAAILSLGFSAGLGFIHTGWQLSFVYDIADLYKTAISIPIAFRCAAESPIDLEKRVRHACRDRFREINLLGRLSEDLPRALGMKRETVDAFFAEDTGDTNPGGLWDIAGGVIAGGINYGDPDS